MLRGMWTNIFHLTHILYENLVGCQFDGRLRKKDSSRLTTKIENIRLPDTTINIYPVKAISTLNCGILSLVFLVANAF